MKIELIKISEDRRRILYKINQEEFIINDKVFKCKKNTSNLSSYLNSINSNLMDLLDSSIDNKCLNCNNCVKHNRFERNTFVKYKFCKECEKNEIIKKYDKVKCVICDKEVERKNIVFSTCGDDKCISEHRSNINKTITNTHWSLNNEKENIIKKRSKTRKENDLLLERKYIAWNKGKTNIYSKETIEKIRNATIIQMKNGKIKKTTIEKKWKTILLTII